MIPAFPTNTRAIITEIINQDGRPVTFNVTASVSGCYNCDLDPISHTSTNSYCPVCSGQYWINTYSGWEVTAHVTWGKSEEKDWQTGGMVDNGECQVKFMHTPEAEEIVHNTEYVVVDDRIMKTIPNGIILRGVPEINRIIVKLKEKER
jgi:hypothetical protein